ncbi:MAG: class I SAM-dependent methyltransferase [Pyrinomonadaceae bacterium]|nr:class I SAM-dependent methyltransferase [Pyrinomonadaceae bacterium]
MENFRPCPSCGAKNGKIRGAKNNFQIRECSKCLTIFIGHLPRLDESENYDSYYTEANLKVPEFIYKRLSDLVESFSSYRQTNRWLDIGFGAGALMQVAAELGWDVYGIEVSKSAVEQAKNLGFKVFHGELHEANYEDGFFDVVTASEILEHLYEPQKLLNEVHRVLRPGGLFWATTPSSRGITPRFLGIDWTVVSPPEHLQIFSKRGVLIMLKNAGFTKIRLQTHGVNPFEIINYFQHYFLLKKENNFDRVITSYQINERLESSSMKKAVKRALNYVLDLAQIGDSIKIYACK